MKKPARHHTVLQKSCPLISTGVLIALMLLPVLLTPHPVKAQLPDARPAVVRFTPVHEIYPQNFSITADNGGYVFLGSTDGVLVFDGEDWQHVPLPNREIVRWLESDGDRRVYVGGFDELGYLERAADGRFAFHSLLRLFEEALAGDLFADIWQISVSEYGVFFVGLEHLFLYQPDSGETRVWKHEGSFGPIETYRGKTFLQWRGEGIKSFDGNSWTLHPQPGLARDFLFDLERLGDDLIIVSNDGQWYRFDGTRFTLLPETEKIPYKGSMTDAFRADDQTLGLTTQLGLIVFYNLKTRRSDVIRVSDGFVPRAIKAPWGSVLAVDDLGFTSLRWPARWRVISSDSGLAGSVSAIRFHRNRTFVLTSSGVYATDAGENEFQRLPWTDYEAWDLLVMEETGEYLFADSYEIKLLGPNGNVTVLDESTTARSFLRSRFDPDIVYAATEFGLQVLKREVDGWRSLSNKDDLPNYTFTHLVERAPGEVWAGSERGGLYRFAVETGMGADVSITATPLDAASGIEYGAQDRSAYLYELGENLVASTGAGLYRFNGEQFEAFRIGDSASLMTDELRGGSTLELAGDEDNLWAFRFNRLYRLEGDHWIQEDVSRLMKGAISILDFHEGHVLAGGLGTILTYDASAVPPAGGPGMLRLTGVQVITDGKVTEHRPLSDIRLSSADERLTITYAMSDYDNPDRVRYRSRLAPIETRFSEWRESGFQSFLDPRPGRYLLLVEAVSGSDTLAQLEVPFEVTPQWFETVWARLLALGLLIATVAGLMRFLNDRKTRLLRQENDQLEQKVTERTRALASANQQLERMAHLDGLTQIPNRRKLDAYLDDVYEQSVERSRVLAVALIDLDHFKEYNDTHGHQAGDALLVELARLLSRNLRRAEDLVARYGGEEFLVVLPGADADSALRVIDGMRHHVEESELNATISAGLHVRTPDADSSVEAMIERADQALYEAKNGGRNRVVLMY